MHGNVRPTQGLAGPCVHTDVPSLKSSVVYKVWTVLREQCPPVPSSVPSLPCPSPRQSFSKTCVTLSVNTSSVACGGSVEGAYSQRDGFGLPQIRIVVRFPCLPQSVGGAGGALRTQFPNFSSRAKQEDRGFGSGLGM